MPVKRRNSKRRADLSDEAVAWLEGQDAGGFHYFESADDLKRLWAEYGPAIVVDWIVDQPGTRPVRWWQYDAPQQPRRRLGGIGTPHHEVLAHAPMYRFGIPASWVTQGEVDYYTGRATDVRGLPIGLEFVGHDFHGYAIEADEPPVFESQAAYLKRLKLLHPGEEARLPADAFEPEAVTP